MKRFQTLLSISSCAATARCSEDYRHYPLKTTRPRHITKQKLPTRTLTFVWSTSPARAASHTRRSSRALLVLYRTPVHRLFSLFARSAQSADVSIHTSPPRGPGRKLVASLYTRKRLSLTGFRVKAWLLRIHAEASLTLPASSSLALHLYPFQLE